jgi:glycosyltransferase involved in cell wall biosynthesis
MVGVATRSTPQPAAAAAEQTGRKFEGARCLAIIPAFNERESVGKLVHRLTRALPGFDLLVIDDGSTDDTPRQVPPGAKVVSLPFNLGIGGAMQTGYRYAMLHGYDVAVQVDADGQHRPSEVKRLVAHLLEGNADLVLGSRFLEAGKYRQTIARLTGSWVLKALIRALTGLHITDCTSGFRAVNAEVIRAFAHWYPEDYPEPEVILLLHRAGYKIDELAVRMRQRKTGQSSIRLLEGLFYVLKLTICLMLDMVREPWPSGKVLRTADVKTNERVRDRNDWAAELDPSDLRCEPAAAGGPPTPSV